jgi:transcriptional regulator with XRE-family HTH domain
MPNRIEAEINPKLLLWARNSIGLPIDDLAKKINTSTQKVEEWETGLSKPTINQLRNIAKVLKRPIAIFYLPEPPKTFDAMKDFRKIADFEHISQSPSIFVEIRRAHYKRDIALELIQDMGENYNLFKETISLSNNYETVAKEIRTTLSISYETQKKWKDTYDAFNSL